jgi:hypothetical protein
VDLQQSLPPGTGDVSAVLTVKQRSLDIDALVQLVGSSPAEEDGNIVDFAFSPASLKFLTPGSYVFDVWLVRDVYRSQVVPVSLFTLQPTVELP